MDQRPNLYDPVVLRDHADREYASRVEALGVGLVVVSQPDGLPADEVFGNGTELSVAWADSDGVVTVLPTRILIAHTEGTLQLWSLVVTGPAVMGQRRQVERVGTAGPVSLRSPEAAETNAVPGSLIDVSEKALRCSVEAGSADRLMRGRSEVIAEFRLGTADFAVPGRIEFARATKHPTRLEELVVVFAEPVADAEALREQVVALQAQTQATGAGDQGPTGPRPPGR